jgi:hypothetical protein
MPQDIDWESARRIAQEQAPKLRPKAAAESWTLWLRDRRAWRLLLTAAALETELARLDGWVVAAADDVEVARAGIRTTPGAFFRGCLARGLEHRGHCPERGGMHLLGRLQHELIDHVAWYERRREQAAAPP